MSVKGMKGPSESDWARVDALTDDTIDTSDIPPLTASQLAHMSLRAPAKGVVITVNVDSDVLAWFQAQGDQCEQQVNVALRVYVERQQAPGPPANP